MPKTDSPTPRKPTYSRQLNTALWIALLVLVVYPLSTGPVCLLTERFRIRFEPLTAIYAPLIYVVKRNESLEQALIWYLRLWYDELPIK